MSFNNTCADTKVPMGTNMKSVFEKIYEAGIIPVIKITDVENAAPLANALKNGGLDVLEVTFRTSCAGEAIAKIKAEVSGVTLIAGTVLTIENAEKAVKAGAEAIVAPGLNPEIVKWCKNNNIPVCPGVSTASEIEQAMSLGLDFVKFFPAESAGGIKMIKALSAPYSNVKFMPTGGVDENNISEYLAFDKVVACGGSWMVKEDLIKDKKFDEIEKLTKSAVKKMVGASLAHIGINETSEEKAKNAAKIFEMLLCGEMKTGNSSIFINNQIEIMKTPYLGKYGHIAIGVNNYKRGKAYFEKLGFKFDENTVKLNDKGQPVAIYFKDEVAGFSVHIVEKK